MENRQCHRHSIPKKPLGIKLLSFIIINQSYHRQISPSRPGTCQKPARNGVTLSMSAYSEDTWSGIPRAYLVHPFKTVWASVPSGAASRPFFISDRSADQAKWRCLRCDWDAPLTPLTAVPLTVPLTPFILTPMPLQLDPLTSFFPTSPFTITGESSSPSTSTYKHPLDQKFSKALVYLTGLSTTSTLIGTLTL